MSSIELILAGAGTGKTTRLAKALQDALVSGSVRPEAVLATTFTRQAAAELAERARTRLLSASRHDDAHRIQAARIGTVNAVCGRLVEQFAFELGLSPDVRVIDDVAAARALNEALSSVATPAETARLAELKSRMEELEWQGAVARVVAAARANGLSGAALADSRDRSLALAKEILGECADDGAAIDAALVAAMQTLVDTVQPGTTVGADKAADRCRKDLVAMKRGRALAWREWASLSELTATKAYATVANVVKAAAAAHDNHPRFHADVCESIELVFALAARTLDAYEATKRRWGVIDFVDQEAHCLALLRRPEIAERLAEEIDLVMVDEFQDTSPLQLAIFLKLAEIAPRSIWVGDQKQSIYGFRGTDPELMEAALELLERRDPAFVDETLAALFEQTTPTTLSESWRSRPALVELTSSLFTAAFAQHGMPADRVRLSPGHREEPEGLGPIVEVWDLQLPNMTRTTEFPLALAAGIDALVGDGEARVRDRASGEARGLGLSDLAVLSRRRKTGQGVAGALQRLGHRVVLPRHGLLTTAEGRLAVAALRRWVQREDVLAGAQIERLTTDETTPDVWLHSLLPRAAQAKQEGPVCPAVRAIDDARRQSPSADPLSALAACIDAVGLRALCRRWGESRQRLGNLDALHSLAAAYVETQASELAVASVPGLLAHFERLAEENGDEQAVLAGDDAVTISTWHAAKGLEWPVVVLFDLEHEYPMTPTGVEVESGRARLDLRDPLADRWIRFLPPPYKHNQRKAAFIERAAQQPFAQQAKARQEREQLRLLYVAWTRARDRLVLAGPAAKMYGKILASLREGKVALLSHPRGGAAEWGGLRLEVPVRVCTPAPGRAASTVPGHGYALQQPRAHALAWRNPSAAVGLGESVEVVEIGPGCAVGSDVDPQRLGEAVHGFLAADDPTHTEDHRRAFAAEVLARWGVTVAGLDVGLVEASEALRRFVNERWPEGIVRRELPVWHRGEDGSVLRGTADMVVELAGGAQYVVVDHKAMLGTLQRGVADAVLYGGQLAAYAEAIEAGTGGVVVGRWIHLPLVGRVVRVE